MKIIFITIVATIITIVGGLITVSSMDVTVAQENIRKEIVIEKTSETPAPTQIPLQ